MKMADRSQAGIFKEATFRQAPSAQLESPGRKRTSYIGRDNYHMVSVTLNIAVM